MGNIKVYLTALLALTGCAASLEGGSRNGGGYKLKYRLRENDITYINFDDSLSHIFDQNIEVKLDGDNFDLHSDKEGRIASKVIRLRSSDKIKVSKKDVTTGFVKEYNIEIDKRGIINDSKLKESIYLPILIGERNGEILEIKDDSNVLSNPFRSNILKIYLKNDKQKILNRFKTIYFSDANQSQFPDRNSSKILESTLENLTIIANNRGKDIGLMLYGLEHFENDNKSNLVALGNVLLTKVDLPYITLIDGTKKQTVSGDAEIDIKPSSFKVGGFKGNVIVKQEDILNAVINQKSYDASSKNSLIKTYNLEAISNSTNQIRFTVVYDDSSNNIYDIVVKIPYDIKIKYRLTENGNYENMSLTDSSVTYFQNAEIILDEENFELYLEGIKQDTKRVILNSSSNFQVKPKAVNTIIKEFRVNIDKSHINSSKELKDAIYFPILIANDSQGNLIELKENTNILPNPFKGNILKIFNKSNSSNALGKFKKFYYCATPDAIGSARNYSKELTAGTIESIMATANNKSSNLILRIFGLEHFAVEGANKGNLIALGSSLETKPDLPHITLTDGQSKHIIISNSTINLIPTSITVGGFKGAINVYYQDYVDTALDSFDLDANDNELIKTFNLKAIQNRLIKKMQFVFSVGTIVVNLPSTSGSLKYKFKENDEYAPLVFINDSVTLNQNLKILLEEDGYDLYVADILQPAKEAIIKTSSTNIKVKYGGVTIKNYTINIDKTLVMKGDDLGGQQLIKQVYSPVLLKIDSNEIVEIRDNTNILPNPFKSNILKGFFINDALTFLKNRFRKFYYVTADPASVIRLLNKTSAQELPVSLEGIENFISTAANRDKGLGIRLYGLEHFEDLGKNNANLITLESSMLTKVDLPYLTLTNGTFKKTISNDNASIYFKPTSFKLGAFRGNITVKYENGAQVVRQEDYSALTNDLIKSYPISLPNSTIDKIRFTLIYEEGGFSNYKYDIVVNISSSIPSLKYRVQEGGSYSPLIFNDNEVTLYQNIQILLEADEYDLYVNGIKQQTKEPIIKEISTIEIKYDNILIASYKINIDKSAIIDSNKELKESIYGCFKISTTGNMIYEDVSDLKLPNPFKSNILTIFIKNNKQGIMNRFKNFYYINSKINSDKKYSLTIAQALLNSLSAVADDKGKDLFLKLYGLEHFEEEGVDKVNLIGLGKSLNTVSDLPYIRLINSTNDAIISGSSGAINFRPTSFAIGGFQGSLTLSFLNSSGSAIAGQLIFDSNNTILIKSWALTSPIDTRAKTMVFQLKYPNNAIHSINVILP